MRQYLLGVLVVSFLLSPIFAIAQTNGTLIDYSGSTRDASAVLDVRSTNQGVLVPRLTTGQRTGIASPANGLLVYDTNFNKFYYYDGSLPGWAAVEGAGGVTSVTANNGLSSSGGATPNITLGGTLNANTTVSQGGNNMVFDMTGTGDFEVRDNGSSALYVKDNGSVGVGTNSPDASAILDIVATNRGMLIPRMTYAQQQAIPSPANSLLIFNTTSDCLEIFAGGAWQSVYCSCPILDPLQPILGPNPVCSGSTVNFSVPSVTGAADFAWTVTGVASGSITGNGSNAISFPAPATSTFAVNVTASNACANSSSSQTRTINAYTTVPLTPTAASSPSAICQAGSYNYSIVSGLGINGTTAIDYTWTITTTGTASATLTANSQTATSGSPVTFTSTATAVTINVGASGSGNVTVSVVGNNTCGSSAVPRTWPLPVNINSANPTSATASASTICNGQSTILTLNGGGGGTGEVIRWYTASCGGALAGTGNGLSVSPTVTTTYYGRYEDPAPCSYNTICQSIIITVDQLSVAPTSISGPSAICDGSSATLSVSGGSLGTGAVVQWFTGSCGGPSAGAGASITVSPSSNTTYYARYNGNCNTTACISFNIVVDQYTVSNAGPDQTLCSTSATLAGNAPISGQGTWSVVSGTGVFANANTPTSGVTGLTTGANVFRWTLPNGGCADSQDDVSITSQSFSVAPTGVTGTITICNGSSTTLTVSGGSAGTGAIAEWFTVSCGGSLVGTGNSVTVSPSSNTTYYVRYNGACNTTTCATTTVTVNAFTTANAGLDQALCATTATLAGNTPTTGGGTWTLVSGAGTITSTTSPTSSIDALGVGANVFRWTLLNGACTDSQDEVTITGQSFSSAPTGVTGTTTICNGSSTTLNVSGGSAGTGAVAQWYTVSCGGTLIGTGNSISVSPTSNTAYYVRYSGTCITTTCASTTVTVDEFTTATAGTDQIVCAASATLGGNSPTTGTGTWTVVSGSGTFVSATDPTTEVNGLDVGANTFRWTLLNGVCTNSQDDVVITRKTPSVAPTGVSGTTTICSGGNTTLTATGGTVGTGATIEWFTGSCGGTAAGTGSAINVSPTSATTYYVRYNGDCNITTCGTVTVTVNTLSTAPTGVTGTTTICSGGNTTLTVTGGSLGTGAGAQWFTGSCGSTSAGTGNSITVSPTSNTTYFVQYSGTCNTTTCTTVTVTVNSLSSAPTGITGTTSICEDASTTLTLSGGSAGTGATAQWFAGSCGSAVIGTGNSVTVSPNVNTTYYVRYFGTCNTTACASVVVNVTQIPADPGFGSGGWNVYAYSGGDISLNGAPKGYYTMPGVTTYDSRSYWGASNSPSDASSWVGCPVPADLHNVVSKRQGFTCGTYQLDMNNHDDWVKVFVNGTEVWEHNSCCDFHSNIWTGLLNASSTIEVRHNEGGGGSHQGLTFNLLAGNSVAPTGITGTLGISSGSSTTLTVSGGAAGSGGVAQWHSGSCSGTLVGTGNSITVSPTSTTTYYVKYVGSCNTTTCASATVVVSTGCTHTIRLRDSFGDGWNGGSVDVYVGGILVLNDITVSTGYGPVNYTFSASTGNAIQVTYSAGGWGYENFFTVISGGGTTLVNDWQPVYSGTWNGTASCVVCPTSPSGSVAYSTSNTNFATNGNTVLRDVQLCAGSTLIFGCSVAGSTSGGDQYFRLAYAGGYVAASDDACGLASNISYTVPAGAAGTYTMWLGGYSSSSASGTINYTVIP